MPPSNKPKPGDRELPKQIRFLTKGAIFINFTWRERLLILLGYCVLIRTNYMSEHNPGRSQNVSETNVTRYKTPDEAMIEAEKRDKARVQEKELARSREEGKKLKAELEANPTETQKP